MEESATRLALAEGAKQRSLFASVVATRKGLLAELQHNASEIDQLWAARKDAIAKSRKRGSQGQSNWLVTGVSDQGAIRSPDDEARRPSSAGENSHKLFLVVDDNQDDFTLLDRALNKVAATALVCWAQDGCEAMEALARLTPRFPAPCLVVDIQLPDMNGFDLVEKIQAEQPGAGMRVVFLTGNTNPHFKARALASGADAFFLKPVRNADFLDIARRLHELVDTVSA